MNSSSSNSTYNEKDYEEIVLRRVFALCFLNTVEYASYRQVLNQARLSDIPNALDYTKVDYNYVCIKRKQMSVILQAIADQPGPRIETIHIMHLIDQWRFLNNDVPIESYHLDKTQHRLVKQAGSEKEARPLVEVDLCPRSAQVRLSFNIAFLKKMLPDLMGDKSFENLDLLATPVNYCPLCELQRVTIESTK